MKEARDSSSPRGLRAIEFADVLDVVARYCVTRAGARHVRDLRPSPEPEEGRRRLAVTDEMVSLIMARDWVPPDVPEVDASCARLSVAGSVLSESELLDLARLLAASRSARSDLKALPGESPGLRFFAERLVSDRPLESRVADSFNAAGEVADSASPSLRRLRRELRGAREAIVKRLEAFARSLPDRVRVPDASVTVRSGRYCVPVRREGAGRIGGIVHDESATHQTLFVEPPMAIDEMNRVAGLEREEEREIRRILAELTDALRPEASSLRASAEALAELDSLYARARYALTHGGSRPDLVPASSSEPLDIVEGVHPLLLETGEPPVRFSLRMESDETVLLVSGPNAGGKTVTLKSIGLLAALAQSGVIPPVGPGTKLPAFDHVYAIIGDEQSISASLSTFSARLAGVAEILRDAGPASLVLLDELGGGTDPAEGAALAAAVLLHLGQRVRLTVATTHLGALKDLAAESNAVVNASLQFDAEHLRPSFLLRRDRPGRSYALEIAERLGLPARILVDARERLSGTERRLEEVLSDLENAEAEQRRLASRADAGVRALERRSRALEERQRNLESREKQVEREARQQRAEGRREAETYLKDARAHVEEVIRELREAAVVDESAERDARRTVEAHLRDLRSEIDHDGTDSPNASAVPEREDLSVGDRARSRSLDLAGEIREVRGGEAILETRGVRFTVPTSDLVRVAGQEQDVSADGASPRPRGSVAVPALEDEARSEIDLRGMRVDEIERPLMEAIDAAIVADLGRLVVIHGKGTGALREEVARLVQADERGLSFRAGGLAEGGSGVTVVELREGHP